MNWLKIIICFSFLCLVNIALYAQQKRVSSQNQAWVGFIHNAKLNSKWGYTADVHVRRNNFLSAPSFSVLRAGITYYVNNQFTFTNGYAQLWLSPNNTNYKAVINENRIYQQFQLQSHANKVSLLHRIRNEQRWQTRVSNDNPTDTINFSNRIRYLLNITIPIFKNKNLPSIVLADELMFQFGKHIVYNTFDQNRWYIGLKQPISSVLSVDFGYMNLYQQRENGFEYVNNHTLRLFVFYNPNFSK
jgi:hypothetical protein